MNVAGQKVVSYIIKLSKLTKSIWGFYIVASIVMTFEYGIRYSIHFIVALIFFWCITRVVSWFWHKVEKTSLVISE
ncbi:MAG: hypothetical protein COZ49_00960 [Candidatus Yonathbacteria bacterium CG_4_10_14_3_um_filter_47_65]|uniref:Uncharacterized protein n=2 Tax=Parcubacteria group TaxID=1794811 RepID=A0A2M8D6V3_9BACT|nr:MAG: hypothetical protein AUJ44_03380 [Candidatus Nomurabacteria bacterium CG1_02_47_685]PIP03222.1 MAG: hypothetical protein COX54_04430 [Candidatus Yonathbacteria bacterium CG23_combo_of_CG06-09_8_20_14_all_46_18]PIQ33081.1 MAG: hypothetical protein COW61_00435 [Candidatus Yonathbacteria bacterium CG17_big_fil_post_rev_8_21_14_2_50_46_19]PIX56645.1 MAG: hypothetical protein COZ49_00960 [Candidatus Yonathbacteria bacterium CG_4_10_14_3_um_filter_47_65]PIY57791.1 MAG: hypothetical protein CO